MSEVILSPCVECSTSQLPTEGLFRDAIYCDQDGNRYIQVTDPVAAVLLTNIALLLSGGVGPYKTITDTGKDADYTRIISAPFKLDSVDVYYVSGTPQIAIGTTVGGTDILDTITVSTTVLDSVPAIYTTNQTFYVTISGGVVTIKWNYYEV